MSSARSFFASTIQLLSVQPSCKSSAEIGLVWNSVSRANSEKVSCISSAVDFAPRKWFFRYSGLKLLDGVKRNVSPRLIALVGIFNLLLPVSIPQWPLLASSWHEPPLPSHSWPSLHARLHEPSMHLFGIPWRYLLAMSSVHVSWLRGLLAVTCYVMNSAIQLVDLW